jgi:hypothetical protein
MGPLLAAWRMARACRMPAALTASESACSSLPSLRLIGSLVTQTLRASSSTAIAVFICNSSGICAITRRSKQAATGRRCSAKDVPKTSSQFPTPSLDTPHHPPVPRPHLLSYVFAEQPRRWQRSADTARPATHYYQPQGLQTRTRHLSISLLLQVTTSSP